MSTLLNLHNPKRDWRAVLLVVIVFILLFSIAMLSGCNSEKHIANMRAKYCHDKDSVSVIRHDTIVYRDSIRLIELAGDTVIIKLPCLLPEIKIVKKKNGLITTFKSDGKGIVACDCAAQISDTIKKQKEIHSIEINQFKEAFVERVCHKKHVTGWDSFLIWSGAFMWFCFLLIFISLWVKLVMKK